MTSSTQPSFTISCIMCKRKRGGDHGSEQQPGETAYWICPSCQTSEVENTEQLEASLLLDEDALRSIPIGCCNMDGNSDPDTCNCQPCRQRRVLEAEQEHELHVLQKSWMQLRHNVKQMYRDGLNRDMHSSRGKTFDEAKLKQLVHILVERDAHQLYQRMESIGREYVMEVKVNLWEILLGTDQNDPESPIAIDQSAVSVDKAKLFIKATLDHFSRYQETVRHMSGFIEELDSQHLEQFGITWKVINHHLFDAVIYQDELLTVNLPILSKILGVDLITEDETEEERQRRSAVEANIPNLPPAALELAQSFRALDRLMRTSREIWHKAHNLMQVYATKQIQLYRVTLKAKQNMLKKDLEFFKQQRIFFANHLAKTKGKVTEQSTIESSIPCCVDDDFEEEDMEADFSERLHTLLAQGPSMNVPCLGEEAGNTTESQCKRCSTKHCSCDECTLSHLITCGLIAHDERDELRNAAMVEESAFLGVELDNSDSSSSVSASSDEDEQQGDDDGEMDKKKRLSCGKHLSSTGRRRHRAKFATSATNSLFTLHDPYAGDERRKDIMNAYGDWEVPYSMNNTGGTRFSARLRYRSPPVDLSNSPHFKTVSDKPTKESQASDKSTAPIREIKTIQSPTKTATKITSSGNADKSNKNLDMKTSSRNVRVSTCGKRQRAHSESLHSESRSPATKSTPCVNAKSADSRRKMFSDHIFRRMIKGQNDHRYMAKALSSCVSSTKSVSSASSTTTTTTKTTLDFNVDLGKLDWKKLGPGADALRKLLIDRKDAGRLIAAAAGLAANSMNDEGETTDEEYEDVDDEEDEMDDEEEEEIYDEDNWDQGVPCADHRDNNATGNDVSSPPSERVSSRGERGGGGDKHGHCDCCYCEMFGHSGGGGQDSRNCGRVPQIRERLRQKLLKQRELAGGEHHRGQGDGQEEVTDVVNRTPSERRASRTESADQQQRDTSKISSIDNGRGGPNGFNGFNGPNGPNSDQSDAPIDQLLDFINGSDAVAAAAASAKAAKRARQKQRKQEEREKQEAERRRKEEARRAVEEERRKLQVATVAAERQKKAQMAAEKKQQHRLIGEKEKTMEDRAGSAEKKQQQQHRLIGEKEKTTMEDRSGSNKKKPNGKGGSVDQRSRESVERVFKPRTDIEHLDDLERDVERFKGILWGLRPRENRPKVQLNVASIFNKSTLHCVQAAN